VEAVRTYPSEPQHGALSPPFGCAPADGYSASGTPLQPAAPSHPEAAGASRRDALPLSQGPGEKHLPQLLISQQASQGAPVLLSEADMLDRQALGARADSSSAFNRKLAHDVKAAVGTVSLKKTEDEDATVAAVHTGASSSKRGSGSGQRGRTSQCWSKGKSARDGGNGSRHQVSVHCACGINLLAHSAHTLKIPQTSVNMLAHSVYSVPNC
jgi:hypothetical protein